MKTGLKIKFIFLSLILAAVLILSCIKGSVDIPLAKLFLAENRQILTLRILRVILAVIVGSGLAVSGAALQAILRNPLAEPYLLGASSGAGLGALIAIILGFSAFFVPPVAFLCALLSVIIVYNLAKENNRIPAQSLILSGVITSVALSGIIVFLLSISGNENLHGIMWWLWGSLQVYEKGLLLIVSLVVFCGISIIYLLSQDLNAISIGEEDAAHLGINTERIKKILFFLTSLITACLVCVAGVIGFVGLLIPHIMRQIVGPNHKVLIPASCLGGAIFMVFCDLLSRTIFSPVEIPIGVITAIIGAPVFIILLKGTQKIR